MWRSTGQFPWRRGRKAPCLGARFCLVAKELQNPSDHTKNPDLLLICCERVQKNAEARCVPSSSCGTFWTVSTRHNRQLPWTALLRLTEHSLTCPSRAITFQMASRCLANRNGAGIHQCNEPFPPQSLHCYHHWQREGHWYRFFQSRHGQCVRHLNMGAMTVLSGGIGRSISPEAGAMIICAGLAKVNPITVTRWIALPMLVALAFVTICLYVI